MARGQRQILLTAQFQAINDLARFCDNLQRMADIYGTVHPDYRDICLIFIEAAVEMGKNLDQFKHEKM